MKNLNKQELINITGGGVSSWWGEIVGGVLGNVYNFFRDPWNGWGGLNYQDSVPFDEENNLA
jgi:hypothetical protein